MGNKWEPLQSIPIKRYVIVAVIAVRICYPQSGITVFLSAKLGEWVGERCMVRVKVSE